MPVYMCFKLVYLWQNRAHAPVLNLVSFPHQPGYMYARGNETERLISWDCHVIFRGD